MGVYLPGEDTRDLEAAVGSVLEQTFSDFEFLICDDGSGPQARAALEKAAAGDPRIRLVRGAGAVTLPAKLNRCIREAKGRYLARMDADDLSLPQRFEKQTAFLDGRQDIAFVGCNVNLISDGRVYGERVFPPYPMPMDFRFSMPFIHPALLFRADAMRAVGGYSEEKRAELCEDYDLLLRMYAAGFVGCNLQEKLFSYRVGPQDYRKRKYRHRINEARTRFVRFRELGLLPQALPYVVKPLVVGLLPHRWVESLRERRDPGCKKY